MNVTDRNGLLLGGHWIVDISKRIDRWPTPETLCVIDRIEETNGGAAFNMACDLARLLPGTPLHGVGMIGDDAPGRWVLDTCKKWGVHVDGIIVNPKESTSFTDVMTEKESGRRTFFHMPGANAQLAEKHFDLSQFNSKIFYLAYLGLLDSLDSLDKDGRSGASRLFARASELGMITAADLVSVPNDRLSAQVAPCLPGLDILFANEWEAAKLLGEDENQDGVPDVHWIEKMAKSLLEKGVRQSVVIHFSGGAVCASRSDRIFRRGAVKVPAGEIVGTVGAGDAFAGGFLTGVHEGMETSECLELAVCAAAVSLGAITCSDALRPWKECLAFGQKYGFASLI